MHKLEGIYKHWNHCSLRSDCVAYGGVYKPYRTLQRLQREKSARSQNTQNELGQILNNIEAVLLTLQTKYDGPYVPYENNNAKP